MQGLVNRVRLAVAQHLQAGFRSSPQLLLSKGLENTSVAEILRGKPTGVPEGAYCCYTGDKVYDAVKNMIQHNVGCLVVMRPGQESSIAGIVTERDYLTKMVVQERSSRLTFVEDIMTDEKKLISVSPDTSIIKAMELMNEAHVRHIPVVGDGKKVVGMISIVDVVRAVLEQQREELQRLKGFVEGQYY